MPDVPPPVVGTNGFCEDTQPGFICNANDNLNSVYEGVGQFTEIIPPLSKLSLPFETVPNNTLVGQMGFVQFGQATPAYSWRAWFSTTPGGDPLPGAFCETFLGPVAFFFFGQGDGATTALGCDLGTEGGNRYLNLAVECFETEPNGAPTQQCINAPLWNGNYIFQMSVDVFQP